VTTRTFPIALLLLAIAPIRPAAAQPAPPAVTPLEFKCMQNVAKAGSKLVVSRMKCVTKCMSSFWKGLVLDDTRCFFPYADPNTSACVQAAETKATSAMMKKCTSDPFHVLDCPECYEGGDCSATGFPAIWAAQISGQVDSFAPAIFCERTGAFILEMRCQTTTSKVIPKYAGKIERCFDKCMGLALKGLTTFPDCIPAGASPPDDPITAACLATAREDAVDALDHDCHAPPATPDGCGSPYPDAATWADDVEVGFFPNVATVYCASPSGAFVD
jgi:hypothetical protein